MSIFTQTIDIFRKVIKKIIFNAVNFAEVDVISYSYEATAMGN